MGIGSERVGNAGNRVGTKGNTQADRTWLQRIALRPRFTPGSYFREETDIEHKQRDPKSIFKLSYHIGLVQTYILDW